MQDNIQTLIHRITGIQSESNSISSFTQDKETQIKYTARIVSSMLTVIFQQLATSFS